MRRLAGAMILVLLVCLAGLSVAQNESASPAFVLERQIGQPRPAGIQYDPNFDRFVWVSSDGALRLAEGARWLTQNTLYNRGLYNAYRFSHDGRYLALAIETRVEIWDTNTGNRLLDFTPDGALRVEGPLYFSPDDTILSFNTQVRAPQALRRSENDTVNLPYLWDIAAEQGERSSVLPGARAIPFFDYRNGFVYVPNNKAIVGLAERLQVLDISDSGIEVISEIPAQRFEPDPSLVWTGTSDAAVYVQPNNSRTLVQLNTETGDTLDLPVGRDLNYAAIQPLEQLLFSDVSQIVGAELSPRADVPLLRQLLGDGYRSTAGYGAMTVHLLDVLYPATQASGDRPAVLLYVLDEQAGTGRIEFLSPTGIHDLALNPRLNEMALRNEGGAQRIEIYDIQSGLLEHIITPALTTEANVPFAYRVDGEVLVSDFQRFDAVSGALINEDLSYNNGFASFYVDDDNQTLNTVRGNVWQSWDMLTGDLVQRTTFTINDEQIDRSDDGERTLTYPPERGSAEIVDVGSQTRPAVDFVQTLPGASIEQVIPSPDWQHFLVVYSVNSFGQHAPGNEVIVYHIEEGQVWHMAGADLPPNVSRQYGWLDNTRFYVAGEAGGAQSERIYGIHYAANGLPQCLVDAFPDNYTQWADFWERRQYLEQPEDLHRLAQSICALLPADEVTVNNFLFPSPTPTQPPVTPTPAVIAGVPACLTQRFPDEAQAYAQEWRELSEGLTEDETAELETLLCESLTGQTGQPRSNVQPDAANLRVMTFDVESGVRRFGAFIPADDIPDPPAFEVLREAFFQQYRVRPSDIKLSPDRRTLAVRARGDYVLIYRLQQPYETLIAAATATAQADMPPTEEARSISLRPLPTEGFSWQGQPRPTPTPTVTPTIPPTPAESLPGQSRNGEIETVCPFDRVFTLDDLPPDFAASGRIIGRVDDSALPGVLDVASGTLRLSDTLPTCGGEADAGCLYSFGDEWLLRLSDSMEIMRPDGSNRRVLFTDEQFPYLSISQIQWLGRDTLQFVRSVYLPDEEDPVPQMFRAVPDTNFEPQPVTLPERTRYNRLATFYESDQPGADLRFTLASVQFNTGTVYGRRYYMHNRVNNTHTYFAQVNTSDTPDTPSLTTQWHPLGDAFFYRLPDDDTWHVFDTEAQAFYELGNLYDGSWSPNGQRRVNWLTFDADDLPADNASSLGVQVWDYETGLLQRFCIPDRSQSGIRTDGLPVWSLDGRYVAFIYRPQIDEVLANKDQPIIDELPQVETLVLDTQTGSVTQVGESIRMISIWTRSTGAYDE